MNILITEKHLELTAKVRDFAEREVKPVIIQYDQAEEFPVDLIRKLGKLNVFGMQVPLEFGGQGSDTLSYIMVIEELAKMRQATGKLIHIDIEPEPDGLIENSEELIEFFNSYSTIKLYLTSLTAEVEMAVSG